MKAAILHVLLASLVMVLVCAGVSGGGTIFNWWLITGWGRLRDETTIWNEFLWTFLVLLVCGVLSSLQPLIVFLWNARLSVQAAREEEAERKAQAEYERMLLLAEAARSRRQKREQVFVAVGQGVIAALEQHAIELDCLAVDIHRARVELNIAHFFWCVENAAIQILTEEHGRAWILHYRAQQILAERAERAAQQQEPCAIALTQQ